MSDENPKAPVLRKVLFNIFVCAVIFEAIFALGGNRWLEQFVPVGMAQYGMPLGATCSTATDCMNGNCVDGVCCENACGGGDATDCIQCVPGTGACETVSAGVTCRASSPANNPCDPAEVCDGVLASCPPDSKAPEGTDCDDGRRCDGTDACDAFGVCIADEDFTCDDNDPCTDDICVETSSNPDDPCEHDQLTTAECSDDAGPGPGTDAGGGGTDAGGRDAAVIPGFDAGPGGGGGDGCSCKVGGISPTAPWAPLALFGSVLVGLAIRRRRR